jgi:hypothetical protein
MEWATIVAAAISAVAAMYAARAEKNSRPVSNGFANHVLTSLDRIEQNLDKHINDASKH